MPLLRLVARRTIELTPPPSGAPPSIELEAPAINDVDRELLRQLGVVYVDGRDWRDARPIRGRIQGP